MALISPRKGSSPSRRGVIINLLILIHFTALSGFVLYALHRVWLLYHWYQERKLAVTLPHLSSVFPRNYFPFVTVQIPLYNERFVVGRLLEAVAAIEWPKEKLEIQVLDDSTDNTSRIVDEIAAICSMNGVRMVVIRRSNRQRYKAGALDNGMKTSRGEFIAIFDADFVPNPDFLTRTIPHFADEKIGMVQARWGFLNSEHSWLTAIQSLLLGSHFNIEHWVRYRKGLFFNFNGTAGVWRRRAIETAGGWQADTVTEDLDLSYRAQLAGWCFCYIDDVVVPSELPVTLASLRCQQERWTKGSVQTALKILPKVLKTQIPLSVKLESMAHLLASVCWLLGFVVTLTLYPVILSRKYIGPYQIICFDIPIFIFSILAILLYFILYRQAQKNRAPLYVLLMLPFFIIGLSPSMAVAVIKGFLCRGGVFDRTPKFGISSGGKLPIPDCISRQRSLQWLIVNAVLFGYTLLPFLFAFNRNTWSAIPILFVFPLGFFLVMVKDFKELFSDQVSLSRPSSREYSATKGK